MLPIQVRELQQENQHLHLQMAEMEKALQKAADYHHAQQVRTAVVEVVQGNYLEAVQRPC